MNALLIEPTDVLFFRDAVPMSAGQGKGAGCRLPFPSTLHEAFRANLLRVSGETLGCKRVEGRPPGAERKGNWHSSGHDGKTFIATKAFRSLRTVGPLPWAASHGLLLPIPADVATSPDGALARLQLWHDPATAIRDALHRPLDYGPSCLPVATTPPDKKGQLHGWWTTAQMQDYLGGRRGEGDPFKPTPSAILWAAEHRVGVQIDPGSFAAAEGQLYTGCYLRPERQTRFVVWTEVADPAKARNGEADARERERRQLDQLDWLLLGGEFRLARLWHRTEDGKDIRDPLGALRAPPSPPSEDGPCLLKWVLVTPALFAHGSLPGWCADSQKGRPGGPLPPGRVCLALPGRAQLISWCLGKERAVSGFDVVEVRAKPTMLAVPEGGVYYFLCEDRTTATALARKLHWQPRSDFHGEKGCGFGLVSFDVQMHPSSPSIDWLARKLFPDAPSPAPSGFSTGLDDALPSKLQEPAVAYGRPTEASASPEPWSHPWHDQLGLHYHRAIADRVRRQPALLELAKENLRRWFAAEPDSPPSQDRLEWQHILDTEALEGIIRLMTDPSEAGHRRRQSTPFAGILTPEERRAIRDHLLGRRHD